MSKIFSWFGSVVVWAKAHVYLSGAIVIFAAGILWWGYGVFAADSGTTRYVLGTVERGTVVQSVSASGQVASSNQIDIKPKVSGEVTWVGVKAGDVVRAGQTIAQIDNTDAKQAIADAEQSLVQAKLQFQKDEAQAPIDYQKSVETLDDAKADLATTYNDTFNTLSDAYLDLPAAVTGMQNILYGYDIDSQTRSQWNVDQLQNGASDEEVIAPIADVAERDYKIAREKYDASLIEFKKLTRYSKTTELEKFLTTAIDTTTAIAQTLQSELNLLDAYVDDATTHNRTAGSAVTTLRTNARTYLSTANENLSALLNQQKTLDSTKKTIRDNERSIEIYRIGNPGGSNPISLQSSKNDIADQERKLRDLKADLADYVISAPFSGTLASVDVKRFDSVSSGSAVATIMADQKVAELSLNEVDAAKINLKDKATLTLDAIEDLTLTGSIIEMDVAGTVSQGVVSYSVKVGFDSADPRVKSGMTVNASIISKVSQDTLVVPSSAVKTLNGSSFVQVFKPELSNTGGTQGVESDVAPEQAPVEIGISDDASIEILSGLAEGQQIVVRTISGTATAAASATTRTVGGGGATRAGGGGPVFIGR